MTLDMNEIKRSLDDGTWINYLPESQAFWMRSDEALAILIEVSNIANCEKCRELAACCDMICDEHEKDLQETLKAWKVSP